MILKCKMCGGDIELSADKTFGTCEYCGSTMTFPKVDDEQRANRFNRGNQFRRAGEFDKALAVYERIVQEDEDDAEAHWCCALCRFGIEYVEDPNTFEYLPTCHRASFDSFLEDVDYLAALEHSNGITRRQYQKDAQKIAEVQRGILATSQNEEPFDVFICYKESEDDGTRTRDSLFAQDIYYQLTEQGRRVFFSRITLEDKAGTEYEPYIFAALNSAKVMILVTTSAEHANAVWVKNEWSRFLSLMRKDRSKLLLPCYRDMDPYDLPEALSVLQSYDMSKIGFIQDLIRGVNKVLNAQKPKAPVKETVVVQSAAVNPSVTPLLKRIFLFLEDGEFDRADEFCEKVLNLDPENGEAYLGKLMVELKVGKREQLKDQRVPFDGNKTYQKALRFGNEKLRAELTGAVGSIKKRIAEEKRQAELARQEGIYQKATQRLKTQDFSGAKALFDSILDYKDATEQSKLCVERAETARQEGIYQKADGLMKVGKFSEAKNLFDSISGYKDAAAWSVTCVEKAEAARKDGIYVQASAQMKKDTEEDLERAIRLFGTIPGWRDADKHVAACRTRIDGIKARKEADRLARERRAEEERKAEERRKKKKRVTAWICVLLANLVVWTYFLWIKVIQPNQQYDTAMTLYDAGKYEEAITAFEALKGYRDSAKQIEACQTAIYGEKYNAAIALYNAGKYEEAIIAFEALNGYRDSAERIKEIEAVLRENCTYSLQKASVGSTAFFGSYEQDNDTSNGKEAIEWVVLAKENNRILLISKYILDCQKYNRNYVATWETSALRKWLNTTFLNEAFNTNEQQCIVSTKVKAEKNPSYSTDPGNNTTDNVFLLSIQEANRYFSSDAERQGAMTAYARSQQSRSSGEHYNWWLRTIGNGPGSAAYVHSDGYVYEAGNPIYNVKFGVRPAMWIDLG